MHCPPRCPSATLTPVTIALTRFAAAQRGAAAAASDAAAAAAAAAPAVIRFLEGYGDFGAGNAASPAADLRRRFDCRSFKADGGPVRPGLKRYIPCRRNGYVEAVLSLARPTTPSLQALDPPQRVAMPILHLQQQALSGDVRVTPAVVAPPPPRPHTRPPTQNGAADPGRVARE